MLKLLCVHKKNQIVYPFINFKRWQLAPKAHGSGYIKKIFATVGCTSEVNYIKLLKFLNLRKVEAVFSLRGKLLLLKQQQFSNNIYFLIKNKFYKGVRYSKKLPVRGQRTHTNAQTSRVLGNIRASIVVK